MRPESMQWNIGIQHVFHGDYTFESRYLGTRGIHLPVQAQMNRVPTVERGERAAVLHHGSQPGDSQRADHFLEPDQRELRSRSLSSIPLTMPPDSPASSPPTSPGVTPPITAGPTS